MLSSKSKTGLSEASHKKTTPPTPKVNKPSRGVAKSDPDSSSPRLNSRSLNDRAPRLVDSKPNVERRSPRTTTTPDKQQMRTSKGSELQVQLNQVQEDLKKLKEQLASVEKEKVETLEELKEVKRLAGEANDKLGEALVAQKRAEETTEIEKFRADELEQTGIEAAQKREDEWKKEMEAVRNQHATDVTTLMSTTQELQRVKDELAMTLDTKNEALSHVDEATKIAEVNAEKVEFLSVELSKVKALLDSKLEANETTELVKTLNTEVDYLKQELEKAKVSKGKLAETEVLIEKLRVELDIARKAESNAGNMVEELQMKARKLETQVYEAKQSERSASESLASLMEQIEGKSELLQVTDSEVASLREKVDSLEMSIGRQRKDLEESKQRFYTAKQESSEMARMVELLNMELETLKEEKMQALNNEKLAASSVQSLLEDKNNLINELEASRDEEDKSKKAMESLASALHEVSSEAREVKEKLLSSQTELENAETQIEDLKLVLKAKNEKYESMLDEAKHEIDLLTNTTLQSKLEIEDSKAVWDQKELNFMNLLKKSEEETSSLKKEKDRLISLLKEAEEEATIAKKEGVEMQNSLKQAESEVGSLKGVVDEVIAQSVILKEKLLDKENELRSIAQENEDLRIREDFALEKVKDLSKLLEEESSAKKTTEENEDLSDSEKDYDLLPKVVEFSAENGERREEEKSNVEEIPSRQPDKSERDKDLSKVVENGNGNQKEREEDEVEEEEGDSGEVETTMWENCKIGEKDLLPDKEVEPELFEEELDTKVDDDGFDQLNGLSSTENMDNGSSSPPTKQLQPRKKKPLLHKFGNLLKKKGSTNK